MESCKAIEELKDSHIENMKIKTRRLKGHENVSNLCDNFKTNTLIKLPRVYIKESKDLHFNSSPLYQY